MLTPREQLAKVLQEARVSAGYASHGALAKKLNVSRPVVTRAENAAHPVPTDAVLASWAGATGVALDTLTDLAQRAKSGTPDWFVPYKSAENSADTVRCWGCVLCPGLLQCEAYARAVLSVESYTPERLDELVTARMERHGLLDHAFVTGIIDYHALQRCVGNPAVMAEQCAHLARLAVRPNIAVHILPEGCNLGTWGALDIASRDGMLTVCLGTLQDVTSTSSDLASLAMRAWERLLGSALPQTDSLDLIRESESGWKTRT